MIIQQTAISLRYKKIDNLKRMYFANEEILKDQFNEATVLPIPDDAPFDVPRIVVSSKNEHSQFNITPVNATLQTNYNDGYEKDWQACKNYIIQKMDSVFSFLNVMTKNEYEFIGIVTTILIDGLNDKPTKILTNNLLNWSSQKDIYDLNIRYTFVEEERYFVNIALQNARLFNNAMQSDIAGSLGIKNQVAEAVGAIIDINDRYGFNNDSNYKTNQSTLDRLVEILSNNIDNKLRMLIEEGVY